MMFNLTCLALVVTAAVVAIYRRVKKWKRGKPVRGRAELTEKDLRDLTKLRSMNGNGQHKTGTHD